MKKAFVLLVAVMMVFALCAACSTPSAPETSSSAPETSSSAPEAPSSAPETSAPETAGETKHYVIGVSSCDAAHPGLTQLHMGLEDNMRPGDEYILTDAALDQAKQISQCDNLLTKGIDLLLVDGVDSMGIKPVIEQAKSKGVPVITYNAKVDESYKDLPDAAVAIDNYQIGYASGEALAKQLGEKGNIAMYKYDIVVVCLDRAQGFKDAIAQYPDMKIIHEEDGTNTPEAAISITENWMKAYPELDAIWASNMQPGFGICAAIEGANKIGELGFVGCCDGLQNEVEQFQKGTMIAGGMIPAYDVGKYAILTAYAFLEEEPLPDLSEMTVYQLTPDNYSEAYKNLGFNVD